MFVYDVYRRGSRVGEDRVWRSPSSVCLGWIEDRVDVLRPVTLPGED